MSLIELNDIKKSFGKKEVLKSINLSIANKEIVGLVGKSGAGKSVLIRILIGFLKAESGKITINSQSPSPIGYSMQENALYDYLTVKQNLDYFSRINGISRKIRKERINNLIRNLSLEEYRNILIKNLSGGTKKRVDLACSLLGDPDFLILDEPLLGLDPELVNNFSNFIADLNKKGTTILISSHQINELSQLCSRLVLLKDGQLFSVKKDQLKNIYK